jgi:Leucine-rich repeat (LRR) protein
MKKHELKQLIKETILTELEPISTNQQIYGITVSGEKIKLELDENGALLCSFDDENEDEDEDENIWVGNLKTLVVNDPRVTEIHCDRNQLTTLKLGNLPNLKRLFCYFNQLTSLDLSKYPNLKELYCQNNQLTSLNVSKCPNLVFLYCKNNQLTSLDVSKCSSLKYLTYDKDKTQLIK